MGSDTTQLSGFVLYCNVASCDLQVVFAKMPRDYEVHQVGADLRVGGNRARCNTVEFCFNV